MAITAFLSRSPRLLNREPGGQPLWVLVLSTASDLQLIWTSCAPSYIIVRRPPSCGRHKSHLCNPSTVKVIFWYSSTGCTCYLYRCISCFDSLARSEVNMQQLQNNNIYMLGIQFFSNLINMYLDSSCTSLIKEEKQKSFLGKFFFHHLGFSDYCLHLYCYFHNVSVDKSFGLLQVFVKLGNLHRTSNYVLYWIHGLGFMAHQPL